MLYSVVLLLHSWLRWAVVVVGVLALVKALLGWARGKAWTPGDRGLQLAFVSAFDLQMLLGMTLYFALSPITPRSLDALKMSMSVGHLRFFGLEHPLLMLLALTAAHAASAMTRREAPSRTRHRTWAVGLLLAMLFVAMAIPWPGLSHGRPLLRGF
ncbi:hypothetical protein [Corallococcus macrosporus]|uniref:Cytochrome b561 bacterial/Ni-hydrogenase domain-containing protein n=1 Tax=Myxococcus fulvus (strain ATCC BAA-855 / HW-1) TaxID=483219 RepID=F8CH47_MYXFH|nr:hypothetical protein [Corallococcus macrosporus]AEI64964.1 hypothetical protein LILAB_15305 [Corallococcus macrosporus]